MLQSMGVNVIKKFNVKAVPLVRAWLLDDTIIKIDYPDATEEIINLIVENHAGKQKINTHHDIEQYSSFL